MSRELPTLAPEDIHNKLDMNAHGVPLVIQSGCPRHDLYALLYAVIAILVVYCLFYNTFKLAHERYETSWIYDFQCFLNYSAPIPALEVLCEQKSIEHDEF